MFRRPPLGTARGISVPFLASFSPCTVTERAEGRAALSWEMKQGGILKSSISPLCTVSQASEIGSKTIFETVRALHVPSGRELNIVLKAREFEGKTEFSPLFHF